MAKYNPPVFVALDSFACEIDGERLHFVKGDPIESGHAAVLRFPHLFGPLVFRYPIRERMEQATATPGEKRGA